MNRFKFALLLLFLPLFAIAGGLKTSDNGKSFLKEKEGFEEVSYFDGSLWTIGFGNTFYPDLKPVRRGDRITKAQGDQILDFVLQRSFEPQLNRLITSDLTQSQFDALVSYAYNRGVNKFSKSDLLKMVNQNPQNPAIASQFVAEWGTNQKFKNGLIRRRKQEAELYFSDFILRQNPDTKIPVYEPKPKPKQKWILYVAFSLALSVLLSYLFGLKYQISLKITGKN